MSEWKQAGTPEQPLRVKMPDGSWRTYAGGTGPELRRKRKDGSWEVIATGGSGYPVTPTPPLVPEELYGRPRTVIGTTVVSSPPMSSASRPEARTLHSRGGYPEWENQYTTYYDYDSEFSLALTEQYLDSIGWPDSVTQAYLDFSYSSSYGSSHVDNVDPSVPGWDWKSVPARLNGTLLVPFDYPTWGALRVTVSVPSTTVFQLTLDEVPPPPYVPGSYETSAHDVIYTIRELIIRDSRVPQPLP